MEALQRAISGLEAQIAALGAHEASISKRPVALSEDWFTLRALGLGLSILRCMQTKDMQDPAVIERFYRDCAKSAKLTGLPAPEPVPPPTEVAGPGR